jgi:hypothetical protein
VTEAQGLENLPAIIVDPHPARKNIPELNVMLGGCCPVVG